MKWKWKSLKVAQSRPTLYDPMDYAVDGIPQARIPEWVAFPFSRGSSQPRDQTQVSYIAGRFLYQLSHQGSPGHNIIVPLRDRIYVNLLIN